MNKPAHIGAAIVMLAAMSGAWAATWYSSSSASGSGNGSQTNPWALAVAITNSSLVQPGDSLYLSGGTYHGPFLSYLSGASNSYVTVRSAPSEWAIIKDPLNGVLLTNLPGDSERVDNVPISGSEYWPAGTVGIIGVEQFHLTVKQGTNWSIDRGWNGTATTAHSTGDAIKPNMDFFTQYGSYVMFRDFEITSDWSTNRVVGLSNWLGSGLNLISGQGNKAVDLVVHNVGHPGIGLWSQGDGGEINGCIIWGNGIYDLEGTWVRGAGIYTQNQEGRVQIRNNIIFDNITEGTHAYGEGNTAAGYRFVNNAYLNNANASQGLLIGTKTIPTSDNEVCTNYFGMNAPYFGYVSLTNTGLSFLGNVVVASPTICLAHQQSGTVVGNTVFYDHDVDVNNPMLSFTYPEGNQAELQWTFDSNSYYVTNSDGDFTFHTADVSAHASDNSGRLLFSNDGTNSWQAYTTWDSNSTYSASWPSNTTVYANVLDYDANQWHICVVNTSTATNANVNLSSLGFAAGARWTLRDAQNYFSVIGSGTYSGSGTIALPLTLTNLAEVAGVTNFVPKHTNIDRPRLFNAFVLTRTAATTLRATAANIGTLRMAP